MVVGLCFDEIVVIDEEVVVLDARCGGVFSVVLDLFALLVVNGLLFFQFLYLLLSGLTLLSLFSLAHDEPRVKINIVIRRSHELDSRTLVLVIDI